MVQGHRIGALLLVMSSLGVGGGALAEDEEMPRNKGAFSIGAIIGEPLAISAKLYLSSDTAIDGAVGAAIVAGGLHAHGDFLWHPWIIARDETFTLPVHVGVGGRLLNHQRGMHVDDFHLGVRGVLGLAFDFNELPIDVFVEIAPIVDLRTGGDDHGGFPKLDMNVALGLRYYP